MKRIRSLPALGLLLFPVLPGAQEAQQEELPVITVDGQPFYSWQEYAASDIFRQKNLRCGAAEHQPGAPQFFSQSDCSSSNSSFLPEYEPQNNPVVTIPVVVHILQSSSGTGAISDALVHSQIDILNEDFRAIPGTNGANGTDSRIEFVLASVDPSGSPTTGITRSMNTTWFNDGGGYWNTLNWDPTRYLNIYTNQAGGALGYVPFLPASGPVGAASDRVVCLWSAFGRNAPFGPPYDQGRTVTHEVGHYLGLSHTFSGGCASAASCENNGDLICDTNPESSPTFGCPSSRNTCSSPDPFDNYMDYSDDLCMEMFTPQQSNRMRCTLENWRPDLADSQVCAIAANTTLRPGGGNPNDYTSGPAVQGSTVTMSVTNSDYQFVTVFGYARPSFLDIGGGQILLIEPSSAFFFSTALSGAPNFSSTIGVPTVFELCGTTVFTQAVMAIPNDPKMPVFQLTNAVDMRVGA